MGMFAQNMLDEALLIYRKSQGKDLAKSLWSLLVPSRCDDIGVFRLNCNGLHTVLNIFRYLDFKILIKHYISKVVIFFIYCPATKPFHLSINQIQPKTMNLTMFIM